MTWDDARDTITHIDDLCDLDFMDPPTRIARFEATRLTRILEDHGTHPPLRVLPDGEGGIHIEFVSHTTQIFQRAAITNLGESVLEQYLDCQFIQSFPLCTACPQT